jgi:hypothetical protein
MVCTLENISIFSKKNSHKLLRSYNFLNNNDKIQNCKFDNVTGSDILIYGYKGIYLLDQLRNFWIKNQVEFTN